MKRVGNMKGVVIVQRMAGKDWGNDPVLWYPLHRGTPITSLKFF